MKVSPHHRRRLWVSRGMLGLCAVFAGLAMVALVAILGYVVVKGIGSLNLAFFTRLPSPVGEVGGGMVNAITGSLVLIIVGLAVALPVGMMAGIFLSEFGGNRWGTLVRYVADVLTGVPSIVIGIVVYTLIVVPMGGFSALAGGIALAIIAIPIITRTTEEVLRSVPGSLREAALALGVPPWRTILRVVLPAARSGIITGVLLSLARIAGETAPLLFTALSSRYWFSGLGHPTASLPVYIFTYANSPYDDWHAQAWAAALVLVTLVLILSGTARFVLARRGGS